MLQNKNLLPAFLLFNLLLIVNAPTLAQEFSSEVQKKTQSISTQVMSPFCPGRSLNDCPSSAASELKLKISSMLDEGKDSEQVLDELFNLYGEEIRAMPKKEGFGLFAWLAPFFFLGTGFVFFLLWLKKHGNQEKQKESPVELKPNMLKRIEKEVSE